ncbi:molecular chaperone [Advenella sp. RU8]|uniref:fimbrial biogenesis chaperone n=1 Tax=Advenella sp. RU8 TaxID=3399575 RepID=UPI003AAD9797
MRVSHVVKSVLLSLATITATPIMAAGLQVTPIMLEIGKSQPSDGLWLTNTGNNPLHAQVRVFEWTQQNNKDVLQKTQSFVASPPLIQIEAGQKQFVRLVRTGQQQNQHETAYRIVVDELPLESETRKGITFVLRYSVPVFIQGSQEKQEAALNWKITSNNSKAAVLSVTNTGNTRAQLSDLSFTPAKGKKVSLNKGLVGYVLGNNSMEWVISPKAQLFAAGGTLNVVVNGKLQTISINGLNR